MWRVSPVLEGYKRGLPAYWHIHSAFMAPSHKVAAIVVEVATGCSVMFPAADFRDGPEKLSITAVCRSGSCAVAMIRKGCGCVHVVSGRGV